VRALRPLRALKRVPGMPVLVGSILTAIPALGHVGMLTAFFFLVWGIVSGTRRLRTRRLRTRAWPAHPPPAHPPPAHPRPAHNAAVMPR
jgi:hypothetical protein